MNLSFRTALAARNLLVPCSECALDRNTPDGIELDHQHPAAPSKSAGSPPLKRFGMTEFGLAADVRIDKLRIKQADAKRAAYLKPVIPNRVSGEEPAYPLQRACTR